MNDFCKETSVNIRKFVTPEIIFGQGALSQIGESAARSGASKVFVVTDRGVMEAGWVDQALHYLRAAGLDFEIFSDITSNPKDFEVAEGVSHYLRSGCDALVVVGGGSPADTAKAIAMLATNGGTLRDFEGINKIHLPLPPMVIAPTTAGTGSEVSQFAIIVDHQRRLKMSIISKSLIPDIAIIDPELLTTKSPRLAAATGMDALSHAIESYVSLAATPLTDIHALNAIRLIFGYLHRCVFHRQDLEANTHMAMASLNAGIAFSNAILGAGHAMTHQVDGLLDTHHGETNAMLLPHVMEFNLPACRAKYEEIARAMGPEVLAAGPPETLAERAINAVRQLACDIRLGRNLSAVGLQAESLRTLSRNALNDACLVTNPRHADLVDIQRIFEKAF
jgi:1,3-propanediol dehydrogenase|nr:iron-containing alcohol dehydrogenase [Desulfuromonas sp. CSMB_57]